MHTQCPCVCSQCTVHSAHTVPLSPNTHNTQTWSIEDKAAVDFALSKLNAKSRSMHYDTRWVVGSPREMCVCNARPMCTVLMVW